MGPLTPRPPLDSKGDRAQDEKELCPCLLKHFLHRSYEERLPFIMLLEITPPIHILYENTEGRYLNPFLIRHFF